MAAARRRLSGEMARRFTCPASPDLEIVREHMPLHASQNLISWSYEPVTRMTDMAGSNEARDTDLRLSLAGWDWMLM